MGIEVVCIEYTFYIFMYLFSAKTILDAFSYTRWTKPRTNSDCITFTITTGLAIYHGTKRNLTIVKAPLYYAIIYESS